VPEVAASMLLLPDTRASSSSRVNMLHDSQPVPFSCTTRHCYASSSSSSSSRQNACCVGAGRILALEGKHWRLGGTHETQGRLRQPCLNGEGLCMSCCYWLVSTAPDGARAVSAVACCSGAWV
jgi:hypothetical protein